MVKETMTSFEQSPGAMRARRGSKWHHYAEDILPAWVADMDFTVPDPVQRAISRVVEERDYGYPWRAKADSLEAAFSARMVERFGWQTDPSLVLPIAELVQALFLTVMAFSDPGDGVVMQTPIYPPFLNAIDQTGRKRVNNPLADSGTRFVLDVEGLHRAVDARTRVILLCSPHNPTGRVWERAELAAIADLAIARDLVIVSDEIHADLVYPGSCHTPIASLGEDVAARTVTLSSATKSFNIAGLRCALIHFGSEALRERFRSRFPDRALGAVNSVGVDATVAAWRDGQPWLDQVMARLRVNRDRLATWVKEEAPTIHHYAPESTYLAWLDCRDLPVPEGNPHAFFLKEGKVGLSRGREFGPQGGTCVRLNFATSADTLEDMMRRMRTALKRLA
jgi:cystathionine beta-lyase